MLDLMAGQWKYWEESKRRIVSLYYGTDDLSTSLEKSLSEQLYHNKIHFGIHRPGISIVGQLTQFVSPRF